MDINIAIQILSVIVQAYATMLSIMSGFFIFFTEYHKRQEKEKAPMEQKQLGLIQFAKTYNSFTIFFGVCITIIMLLLMVMWLIGSLTFTSETLAYFTLALIFLSSVGFLSLFCLVIKIIQRMTSVFYW